MDKGNWPGMSRTARAIEILEAINEHFKYDQVLNPGALILDDDSTIKEAIAQCLGREGK
jgi:hypothetical protein